MFNMDKHRIKHIVQKGLECQFNIYSWEDMIDDLDLTPKEKEWAKKHLSYRVVEY